jgi:hypothetical protein
MRRVEGERKIQRVPRQPNGDDLLELRDASRLNLYCHYSARIGI